MNVSNMKSFVLRNKEILMCLVGFGIMHIGWYNLQRSSTLNKALAASREKEIAKEYKKLEREIEKNWSSPSQVHPVQSQESQNSGVVLSAATAFTEKNT